MKRTLNNLIIAGILLGSVIGSALIANASICIVAQGCTGVSSFIPFAPIFGGTTAAGSLQNAPSLGSAGQVLTSNDAGAIATFQTPQVTGLIVAGANVSISGSGTSSSPYSIASSAGGSGTVTSVSVTTNQGVSGSVATSTTTPAITLSLGALTGATSYNGLVVT